MLLPEDRQIAPLLPTTFLHRPQIVELVGDLLDVCAAWCGPCRASLPTYARVQRELGSRGFTVLAVSVDEDADAVRRDLDPAALPFPVALDPAGRVPDLLGVDTMPECFLIDREGRLRLRPRGFRGGDGERLRAEAIRLLEER